MTMTSPMSSTADDHSRLPAGAEPITPEQSKLIFNNSYMSTVMIAIASLPEQTFSGKQIADATGVQSGIVHTLIQRLHGAHFIEFVARVPGERTLLYRVCENPWWKAARRYSEISPQRLEESRGDGVEAS